MRIETLSEETGLAFLGRRMTTIHQLTMSQISSVGKPSPRTAASIASSSRSAFPGGEAPRNAVSWRVRYEGTPTKSQKLVSLPSASKPSATSVSAMRHDVSVLSG